MDILIDTFKTCFDDIIILLEESLKCCNRLFISLTDIFYINSIAKNIFKLIRLKKIPIRFYFNKTNCWFAHYGYNSCKAELWFGLAMFSNESILKELFDSIDYKFNNRKDKLFFVVAHEIGHYLQWENYKEWYYRNAEIRCTEQVFCRSPKSYRTIKLERFADMLAIGIYKRLKGGNNLCIK
jgi:hypothetical protein